MKTLSSRSLALAGLVALFGLYGCNEDDGGKPKKGAAEVQLSRDTSSTAWPKYADASASAQKAVAMASSSAAQENPSTPAEKIKEISNASFDGSKEQKGLDQSSAVVVPASPEKKDVQYTQAPPKKQLDEEAAAPPAPEPKDPEVAACERVLAAHGQAADGCAAHPSLSLEWAGIKDALSEEFGSVEAVLGTLVLSAVGMILSGGWAAVAKVVKMLLFGAAGWMLVKQLYLLYQAIKALFSADKGSDEYAEGLRQLTKSATILAISAGAFKAGRMVGEARAVPKQGELPFPEKPGLGTRLWQGVRGWLSPAHA